MYQQRYVIDQDISVMDSTPSVSSGKEATPAIPSSANVITPRTETTNKGFSNFDNLKQLKIGNGAQMFQVNYQGISLGSNQWASAPFRVDMTGAMTATSATIAGWVIGTTTITSTGVTLASGTPAYISFGTTPPASATVGTGIYIDRTGLYGLNANTQNFIISAATGNITSISGSIAAFTIASTTLSATNLTLTSGAANTANITVGTGANAGGINSANGASDIIFWGGATFANRATAPFRVTAAGSVVGTTVTLAGQWTASTGGVVAFGQSAYNTGAGYWLEYNGGTPRFSIGDGTTTNSMTWDGTTLLVNGSALAGQVFYGNGSDGTVTIASGTTTLTRNMYYINLTISAGATLLPNGYQVFVRGTLNNAGTIQRNGNNGANGGTGAGSGTGGAALAAGTLSGTTAGATGPAGVASDAAGANGASTVNITDAAGVSGARGGTGGAGIGAGGGEGGAGSLTAAVSGTRNIAEAVILRNSLSGSFNQITSSSASGSGGAGGGQSTGGSCVGGDGGGGGSPGGILAIYARTIINSGTISANGGNGGNGGNGQVNGFTSGGGGGGGAGSGGVVVLVYRSLTNTGTISANAGSVGTGGAAGTTGSPGNSGHTGNAGVVIQLQE